MNDHSPSNEVRLWRIPLMANSREVRRAEATLAPDEQHRAARLRAPADARRFVLRRAARREILAKMIGVDPASLRFATGVNGRPYLRGTPDLDLNTSCAGDLAIIAITRGHRIGVDIAQLAAVGDPQVLASVCCAEEEISRLRAMPAAQHTLAVAELWTRKEAVLKATGEGLSYPPASLRVDTPSVTHRGTTWTLHDLAPGAGFVGALATERSDIEIVWRRWRQGSAKRRGGNETREQRDRRAREMPRAPGP